METKRIIVGGVVKSDKIFVIRLAGELPVGMNEQELGIAIQHGLSMTVALRKLVTDMSVTIGQVPPEGFKPEGMQQ